MKIEKLKDYKPIDEKAKVIVKEMGNIFEVKYLSHKNNHCPIIMFPDGYYFDKRTEEVKKCVKSEKRINRLNSLRRTFQKVRDLINTNITDPKNVRWITLTYAENMQDTERLYNDFDKFHKRFKYYIKKNFDEEKHCFEYISVIEPQGRGAWHIHLLYIWNCVAPYIENEVLRKIWRFGFVKVKALKDIEAVDNIGAYLVSYLSDLPLNDENIFEEVKNDLEGQNGANNNIQIKEVTDKKTGKKKEKMIIKGGRLDLYSANMNIYRTSRGIKKPTTEEMRYKKVIKKVSGATKTFSKSIQLTDEASNFTMLISTEYYNRVRGEKQGSKKGEE